MAKGKTDEKFRDEIHAEFSFLHPILNNSVRSSVSRFEVGIVFVCLFG